MQKITFILLVTFPVFLFSQNKKEYSSLLIPPELRENSNAVVRRQQIEFNVETIGKAVFKEYRAVTIFNEKSNYDKMVKL